MNNTKQLCNYQDSQTVNCPTPSVRTNGTVGIWFELDSERLPIPFTFQFYIEPILLRLHPSEGPSNAVITVLVEGRGFLNMQTSCCVWANFNAPGANIWINESFVNCTSQPGIGTVPVAVSLNAHERTNILNFTYQMHILPPSNTPGSHIIPGWVWVALIFGGATTLVIFILIIGRRCSRGQDPERQSLLGSRKDPGVPFIKQIDISDIQIKERIGKGTFGEVYKGIWNGTEVGVKFLTPTNITEQFLQDFYKEVTIMRSLRHPNVLQFLGACTSAPNVSIVMEYMPKGSLFKILHDESIVLESERIRTMVIDAARGMNYLHISDPIIIHRDLKSHNLLVDDHWRVKVCDFGLSKICQTSSDMNNMTACGTPSWTAPEILRNEHYTTAADVYSFGIVLWECITREDPYYGMPPFQVVLAVGTKGLRPLVPQTCHSCWIKLMTECWSENPSERPSFSSVMNSLEAMKGL